MATKTARAKITFECTECKHRNYDSMKNKKNDPDRLVLKKYCPFCKKHTEHKESKKSISGRSPPKIKRKFLRGGTEVNNGKRNKNKE